jgi:hypothetical protein
MTEGQHRSPPDSFTGKREGKASFFTLTSKFTFHLENGIEKTNLIGKEVYKEAKEITSTEGITVFKCLLLVPMKIILYFEISVFKNIKKELQKHKCTIFRGDFRTKFILLQLLTF